MTHLTDLQISVYVDEALEAEQLRLLSEHVQSCVQCQARVTEITAEKHMISQSLVSEEGVVVPELDMPKFTKPITLRNFALANVVTGLVVWLTQFLWKTLFGELVVNAVTQVTSIYVPGLFDLFVDATLYFTQEGTTMIDNYLGLVVLSFLALTLAWLAVTYRKSRGMISLCLVGTLSFGLLLPPPAAALEIRRDEAGVNVAATEILNDTVVMAGDTIIVDGEVKGNLIAFGRRVVVNGHVGGNLITAAESITVRGDVAGTILSAGESLELVDNAVNGDFWAAGENVTISRDTSVAGNAIIATELASVSGGVGLDLYVFGEIIELSGSVGKNFEAFGRRISLLGDAQVAGNVRIRSDDEDSLQRSPTATVNGEVEFLSMPEEFDQGSRYERGEFYLRQLWRLVSAFVVGMMLLWFLPMFRDETIEGGVSGLKTAGIGLVAMISAPVVMLLLAVTLVGLPLAVIGMMAYGLAVYLAKIVVASIIGQMMLSATDREDSLWLTLLAGLSAIIVAINLPAIGGILNFILTIVGLGLLVQIVLSYSSDLFAD